MKMCLGMRKLCAAPGQFGALSRAVPASQCFVVDNWRRLGKLFSEGWPRNRHSQALISGSSAERTCPLAEIRAMEAIRWLENTIVNPIMGGRRGLDGKTMTME